MCCPIPTVTCFVLGACYNVNRVMGVNLMIRQLLQSLVLTGLLPAILLSSISKRICAEYSIMDEQRKHTEMIEIRVLNDEGEYQTMELEEYVTRVVLGEVSAGFHEEALKAQAVAARTYTMYCIEVLQKHSEGAVCTDYHCCQAYREPEMYLAQGGTEHGIEKVRKAVDDTAGQVLNYDSKLICATYFASSGGQTEDASEVWGRFYPYLRCVESPGEEECGYFSKQVTLTPQELQAALDVELSGQPQSWFGMVTYTAGGGVDLMRIGGRLYTGVELRRLLKLRSTIFSVTATDESIIIDTKGYGHRVGMSQHGANAMAKEGNDYREILAHYYTDTSLHQLES